MFDAPPVVTAGRAALAVAGASSASASVITIAPRIIDPPRKKLTPEPTASARMLAPIHAPQHGGDANVAPRDMIS
jgi:hypothetical protein